MRAREINNTGNAKRMMSIAELADYISMGRTYAAQFGREAGARRQIGRRVLYDKKIIDAALDSMAAE